MNTQEITTCKSVETQNDETHHPVVRYGTDTGSGVYQFPDMQSIHQPIPENAKYGSPVYLVTDDELDRKQSVSNPYAVSDTCIAKQIQDTCESENRVLYPVHVESDAEVPLSTQQSWIHTFVNDNLPIEPYECDWYYSGGSSIHCHVPLFTDDAGRESLKEAAEAFDGDLDPAIYSRKRQFRLPGVEHDTTGLPKTPIEPEWSHERIVREAATTNPERPDSYTDVLRETIGPDWGEFPRWTPKSTSETQSKPHLWEPGQPEPDGGAIDKWQAYNRHAFSPYAHAGNGRRSIAIVRVIGGAFGHDGRTYLPCRIWIAMGCNGELWQNDGPCPVYLSDTDTEKIAPVTQGTELIIIGGNSRSSRIFTVEFDERNVVWDAVLDEAHSEFSADRADTLETIESLGFDSGSTGGVESNNASESRPSRAERLQRQAERMGFNSLSRHNQLLVANRLLASDGFDGAHEWFQEQFGEKYDRDRTQQELLAIASEHDDLPNS